MHNVYLIWIKQMNKIKLFMGFDRPSRIPAYVLADSIIENSSIPVEITFLHKGTLKNFFQGQKANTTVQNLVLVDF